ncbi:MAG: MmyB family transcriptional regulator [Acidimicrobiales bacterium]
MAAPTIGDLLREWRTRRRRSQMDLALDVGVSPRHLSFVETGRSKPSPELVLGLARHLDVPLRERNTLLLAAGFAPRFAETPLDAPAMARARAAVQRMLDAHDPYPGVVLDRSWNVLATNTAAAMLAAGLPEDLLGPPMNIFRVSLHPDGLAGRTRNFAEWAGYLVTQLRRMVVATADSELDQLYAEVTGYPDVAELISRAGWDELDEAALLIPCRLEVGGAELSLFTTLTTFGTPRDITLSELAVELFYPADDATDRLLHGRP